MEKIVTHPLYIRCKKIIDSCQTPEQFEVACKYWLLARKKSRPLFKFSDNWKPFTSYDFTGPKNKWEEHKEIWENMLKGV